MPTTRAQILAILLSSDFGEGEKWVVRNQFPAQCQPSNFESKLWEVMCAADEANLTRLSLGFPVEGSAMMSWRYGTLGERLRKAGLDI